MSPEKAIWPTLVYADAPAAIRFLVEAFGVAGGRRLGRPFSGGAGAAPATR